MRSLDTSLRDLTWTWREYDGMFSIFAAMALFLGRYEVKGLPPSEYRAIAVEYAEEGIWNDSEYLGSIRQDARKLTLRETDALTLSLTLAKLP